MQSLSRLILLFSSLDLGEKVWLMSHLCSSFISMSSCPYQQCYTWGGGGGYSLQWPIRGGSARKGYLFQASGI